MAALTLHPMKEIRVIVSGEHRPFVTELLDKVEATGYTIIGNISGKGHHGAREAHFMFSEQESLISDHGCGTGGEGGVGAGRTRPLFDRHSGVMFVSDVAVSRRDYFGKKREVPESDGAKRSPGMPSHGDADLVFSPMIGSQCAPLVCKRKDGT